MVDDDRLPSPALFYQSELLLPSFVQNPKKRWANAGPCPFRDSCRPRSFVIQLESGAFKCSSCGTSGGGIVAFWMRRYDMAYSEAVDDIKHYWGLR